MVSKSSLCRSERQALKGEARVVCSVGQSFWCHWRVPLRWTGISRCPQSVLCAEELERDGGSVGLTGGEPLGGWVGG